MRSLFKIFLRNEKNLKDDFELTGKSPREEVKNTTLLRRKVLEAAYIRRRDYLNEKLGYM